MPLDRHTGSARLRNLNDRCANRPCLCPSSGFGFNQHRDLRQRRLPTRNTHFQWNGLRDTRPTEAPIGSAGHWTQIDADLDLAGQRGGVKAVCVADALMRDPFKALAAERMGMPRTECMKGHAKCAPNAGSRCCTVQVNPCGGKHLARASACKQPRRRGVQLWPRLSVSSTEE